SPKKIAETLQRILWQGLQTLQD
ncbi:MAG: hypothetical protein QOF10_6069, partial [Kribbellaceae bacterium]|nr:hypothetical protein [Kribbellaceae bacterium]